MSDYAVVIPLYNGAKWIKQTLNSVFNQTIQPSQVIVVDDLSSDDGPDLVGEFQDVILLRNEQNLGTNASRNRGLELTKAPFLIFLDQDDLWHPTHVERLRAVLWAFPDAPMASSSNTTFYDGSEPSFSPGVSGKTMCSRYDPWQIYPFGNAIVTPGTTLIRREALERYGPWQTEFPGVGDFNIWLRLTVHTPGIRLPEKTLAYRRHKHSFLAHQTRNYPVKRLEYRQLSAKNALEFRQVSLSEDPMKSELEKRYALMQPVIGFGEEFLKDDNSAIAESISEIAELIEGESSQFHIFFLTSIRYSLCSSGRWGTFSETAAKLLTILWNNWPREKNKGISQAINHMLKDSGLKVKVTKS